MPLDHDELRQMHRLVVVRLEAAIGQAGREPECSLEFAAIEREIASYRRQILRLRRVFASESI